MFASNSIPRRIPDLVSGGIMLSYRCTNACRHCLYRCSPARPDAWMTREKAREVFSALLAEPALGPVHLAGGEATLHFDLLRDIVAMAAEMGVPLAYLETNAACCHDRDETRRKFSALRDAGLPGILVSASMFHNEFVPFACTRNAVEVGREVFGSGGVMVWLPHLYEVLSELPDPEKPRSLASFCEAVGLPEDSPRIPELYQIVAGGRAPKALRACYKPRPAEHYRRVKCSGELFSTTHFHIDYHGNLFTGLCAGIAPGDTSNLHPEITAESTPVTHTLAESGPCGLCDMAVKHHGFAPREDGYVSKCDLCHDVRVHLLANGDYPELRPADYYEA